MNKEILNFLLEKYGVERVGQREKLYYFLSLPEEAERVEKSFYLFEEGFEDCTFSVVYAVDEYGDFYKLYYKVSFKKEVTAEYGKMVEEISETPNIIEKL
jgi:hypothetical protein